MKSTKEHIEKLKSLLVEQAKAKVEFIEHFKKGGAISDFKPKNGHVARPF